MKVITGSVTGMVKTLQLEARKSVGLARVSPGSPVTVLVWGPQLDEANKEPDCVLAACADGTVAIVSLTNGKPTVLASRVWPMTTQMERPVFLAPLHTPAAGGSAGSGAPLGLVLVVSSDGRVGVLDLTHNHAHLAPEGTSDAAPVLVAGVRVVSSFDDDGYAHAVTVRAPVEAVALAPGAPDAPLLLATGGKEKKLIVTDLSSGARQWCAQNPPNDPQTLLVIPIWPTAACWIGTDRSLLAEVTSHGFIRVYDLSRTESNRAVADTSLDFSLSTCTPLAGTDPVFFVATKTGGVFKYEYEPDHARITCRGKYRGIAGSVRSIGLHPALPLVASGGLDRYVHIHDTRSRKSILSVYNKSKVAALLFSPEGVVKPASAAPAPSAANPRAGNDDEYEYYYGDDDDDDVTKTVDTLDAAIRSPGAARFVDDVLWEELPAAAAAAAKAKRRRGNAGSSGSDDGNDSDSDSDASPPPKRAKRSRASAS